MLPLSNALKVNAGIVKVDIERDGTKLWSQALTLEGGQYQRLYVEAKNAEGRPVSPLPLPPPEAAVKVSSTPQMATDGSDVNLKSPTIYKTWWFWSACGIAVIGGTAAVFLFSRNDQAGLECPVGSDICSRGN
jgi:hypothetical protein